MIFERLDRTVVNDSWLLQFPEASLENFPILDSDHGPIVLTMRKECRVQAKYYADGTFLTAKLGCSSLLRSLCGPFFFDKSEFPDRKENKYS